MHAQLVVDHRHRVAAHLARADGMEDGGAELAGGLLQLRVRLGPPSGPVFFGQIFFQGLRRHDAAGEAHRVDRHPAIFLLLEIIQSDFRVRRRVRRLHAHPAARGRPQIAHARRDRRERMQRLAELVERQRLHVPFDVRRRLARVALREGARLRRRHGERPGAERQVLERHRRLAENAAGHAVQRLDVPHLVLHADLQVVVEILSHAGKIVDDRDLKPVEQVSLSYAGQLQQLRRAYGACGEDRLALRFCVQRLSFPGKLDAERLPVRRAHPGNQRPGQHAEILALQRRPQEGVARAPAPAAALVHLEIGAAEIVAAVEHFHRRDAALGGRLAPGIDDIPAHARVLDAHLAARAVALRSAALVVLQRPEDRQHVVPRPAAVAERGPVVPVLPLAAHVDHGVDRGRAAQHPAARVMDRAAGEIGVGLGPVAPVGARIGDGVEVADRHVDPEPVVAPARLEQQHAAVRVAGQAVGEQAAGASGAGDHVVKAAEVLHLASP